jgi:N-acetylated-alpha-linked acidic dipeptidase
MTSAGHRLGVTALLAGSIFMALAISRGAQNAPEIAGFAFSRVAAERQLEQKFRAIPDPERAESDLRYLTSEPHPAGTEASHRVAEWLRNQYRSFGFDAEVVSYSVWLGYPREAKLEITEPVQEILGSQEQPLVGDKDSDGRKLTPAFNAYSPSGDVTAPVVYVNYGMQEDYRELARLGVSVEGRIALARYGRGYRGIKAKLAEEHRAAGLIIYSDPQDDGYTQGDTYPNGPWRPMTAIQRGSILYTQIYPGDPLTPAAAATSNAKRIAPSEAANLPHILTMPINAQDASAILQNLGGKHVPRGWQGALPFTYHVGGDELVHMKLDMDYAQRPVWDVIAKLRGAEDDQWVILGNHHDAWVYGAADPGSGTAAMLETARALGELARSGWKPRRTIVMAEWGGEEPGLLGSTEWVEANRAELQAKAVAYVNTDVGVTGDEFSASATPSLKQLLRDVTRDVDDPDTGLSVYRVWSERAASPKDPASAPRSLTTVGILGEPPIGELGAGSDFCPFFDYAGIPSMDVGFQGDYGVYHSLYDDLYWMQHFGDPKFTYHTTLAKVLGTLALRLAEADILPYDFQTYASEIDRNTSDLIARAGHDPNDLTSLTPVSNASVQLNDSAIRASEALREISGVTLDPARADEINRALASVEQALLAPQGLVGRPWFKHTIYAPGSYAGYVAEDMPGVSEALDRDDEVTLLRESESLAAALRRAAARLDMVARLAQSAAAAAPEGR